MESPPSNNGEMSATNKLSKMVTDLGKKLQQRSERDTLVQRNILKSTDKPGQSSALLQAKMALEKEKQSDKLASRLQNRPTPEELENRNILRPDKIAGTAAATSAAAVAASPTKSEEEEDAAEQSSEEEYEEDDDANGDEGAVNFRPGAADNAIDRSNHSFQSRQMVLKSCLKRRPEKSDLADRNILKPASVDPSITATAEKLKRAQLENSLASKMRDRPTVNDLLERKILNFNETVEIVPTYRSTEYNRKPDLDATFRKLTPKLKMEIRDELNTFKKEEMEVHMESQHNTAFH